MVAVCREDIRDYARGGYFPDRSLREGIKIPYRFDGVSKKLAPDGILACMGEDIKDTPPQRILTGNADKVLSFEARGVKSFD